MKDKPFALIGINSWAHDPGELKKVMIRDKITWRTFDDDGSINRRWNQPATPTFYIIDHEGVIRRKWVGRVGNAAIDAALETLIASAEHAASSK